MPVRSLPTISSDASRCRTEPDESGHDERATRGIGTRLLDVAGVIDTAQPWENAERDDRLSASAGDTVALRPTTRTLGTALRYAPNHTPSAGTR